MHPAIAWLGYSAAHKLWPDFVQRRLKVETISSHLSRSNLLQYYAPVCEATGRQDPVPLPPGARLKGGLCHHHRVLSRRHNL